MSPEQLSFMIGSIYGSILTLLLLRPSRRSRNRRDPFLDCRYRSGPTTPKPQFPLGRVTDVHGRTIGYRSITPPHEP